MARREPAVVNRLGSVGARTRPWVRNLRLVEREAEIASFFRSSPIGIGEVADRVFLDSNPALSKMTGYSHDELMGMPTRQLYASEAEYLRVRDELYEVSAESGIGWANTELVRNDGTRFSAYVTVSPLDRDDPARGYTFAIVDLSDMRAVEDRARVSEARFHDLVEHARDAVYIARVDGSILEVNAAAEELTGYSRAELLSLNFIQLLTPEARPRAEAEIAQRLAGGRDTPVELELRTKNGDTRFVEVTGRIVDWGDGPPLLEGIARDVTERHVFEDQLRHRALHDDLTGLPNRALLQDRVEHGLERARHSRDGLIVMLLDLDDFKFVNDSQGHQAGDEVLVELAARLRNVLRRGETVARIGGDEFVIVASGEVESAIGALADRVRSVFADEFVVGSARWRLTGTVGVAVADGTESSAAELLRDADIALYTAKSISKGAIQVFDASLRSSLMRRVAIANALQEAVRDDQIAPVYQPIIRVEDGQVLAVEVLARLSHPTWGHVPASEFISIAEANGLIVPIGRSMLEQAARQLAQWKQEAPEALPSGVFVNVSARELAEPDFDTALSDTLSRHGLSAADIALELTERTVVDDHDDVVRANLIKLTGRGIRLVLDDFGTGYSALSSLSRFPLSAVKIDRYFTQLVDNPDADDTITKAIISLGNSLGLTVIAEGIETDAQLRAIRAHGCTTVQGFLLGRPGSADAVTRRLRPAEPALLPGGSVRSSV